MERHAAIVYPKDVAYLTYYGDVRPGMRVIEAGRQRIFDRSLPLQ